MPMTLPSSGRRRFALPGPRAILGVVLLIRLGLMAALSLRAMSAAGSLPLEPLLVLAILAAAGMTALWVIMDLVARRMPSPTSLLLQATVDVLVVTGLVAFTSGETTPIAALYVGLVAAYALLLPVGRGILAVLFALVCYILVTVRSMDVLPGAEFWAQAAVITFVGGLIAILGHRLSDAALTQRKLAEELQLARLEADEILATIRSGVITVDGNGRLAYINPRALRILGGGGFVHGQPVMELIRSRSRDLYDALSRGISGGNRVSRGEASVRRADGSLFPVGVSTTTFVKPGTDAPSVTAIFTDISNLKRLQEFKVRAERLEAVAELSASLAHEIRNPLAAIRSAVEQLAGNASDDDDDQVLATLVMRESARLNRLLSEFLDFSKVHAAKFEPLDLLEVVEGAARTIRQHPDAAGVSIEVTGSATMLEGDADMLHRVASNLILNAAQALRCEGQVSVEVGPVQPREAPSGPVERRIKLVIRDDGPGIPESVRERLFEPFVTGREGGSGLGLAIVQRAVASHRGIILVDTAPGMGTTFSIFLPATWDREDTA